MTRIIGVLAGKGGVGKTTLVSNLAAALAELGEEVIAIDANLTTPNLGLHLGMHLSPVTLHDVLRGDSRLADAIYPHPAGFKIVPSSLRVSDLYEVDVGKLPEITFSLIGKADYVILDCAPSLGREAVSAASAVDEVLIITNPELPAVTDALKTIKIVKETNAKIIGVVVNRVKRRKYELEKEKIEDMLGFPVIAEIPEDKNIPKAIAAKQPVVIFSPYSPASIAIKRLAAYIAGKPFKPPPKSITANLISKLVGWVLS